MNSCCKDLEKFLLKFAHNDYISFRVYISNRMSAFWDIHNGQQVNTAVSELLVLWASMGHPLLEEVRFVQVDGDHPFFVLTRHADITNPQKLAAKTSFIYQMKVFRRMNLADAFDFDAMIGACM